MDPLNTARDRLERALDRLEAAADQLLADDSRTGDPDEAVTLLRAERDRLSKALDDMQRKHADLHTASETVSMRLESAIGRMRSALEE